jgi:tetratricopeptide (TPR) repeat protein
VLLIFDGWIVGEILSDRAIENSQEARNKGDCEEALAWCNDAEAAIHVLREDNEVRFHLGRLKLVRGDIYLHAGQLEVALTTYDDARHDLELLTWQSVSKSFSIASALINSSGALSGLGRKAEARERLERAKAMAEHFPRDNSLRKLILEAASNSLRRLSGN